VTRNSVVGCAGDRGDNGLLGYVGRSKGAVVSTETQYGDSVGDLLHVNHVVANEYDAVAAVTKPHDEIEHFGSLGHPERCRGFVKDDDGGVSDE